MSSSGRPLLRPEDFPDRVVPSRALQLVPANEYAPSVFTTTTVDSWVAAMSGAVYLPATNIALIAPYQFSFTHTVANAQFSWSLALQDLNLNNWLVAGPSTGAFLRLPSTAGDLLWGGGCGLIYTGPGGSANFGTGLINAYLFVYNHTPGTLTFIGNPGYDFGSWLGLGY